ncbi:MAG: UDP-N-acetylglucosamine 2-epimerase [Burkholderiaceae bacterium]|nr:UDP-N-acetylglucosamine 2-epimerase [Burkholderiaceae bacterium]
MKNIVFVTGTRADFGKLQPLAQGAENVGCSVTWYVTGMHMLEKYGLTKIEVFKTGHRVFESINQRESDSQDIIMAKTITSFSDYVLESKPEAVVLHGDRVEALACALVCAMNYIPCIHIEGGEVSGTLDESLRHCVTKLAQFHLVSSNDALNRILRMGEPKERIHLIGSPELDGHLKCSKINIDSVRKRYQISFKDYGICIFHPVTTEQNIIENQTLVLFNALESTKKCFVVIAPNNDPGCKHIFDRLNVLDPKYFRILPSMRFDYFSALMSNSKIFIGNSSAGIREAPFLGIKSINLGTRQLNRSSNGEIINCSALDFEDIVKNINDYWGAKVNQDTTFGDGSAQIRFEDILRSGVFENVNFQKSFIDPTNELLGAQCLA